MNLRGITGHIGGVERGRNYHQYYTHPKFSKIKNINGKRCPEPRRCSSHHCMPLTLALPTSMVSKPSLNNGHTRLHFCGAEALLI